MLEAYNKFVKPCYDEFVKPTMRKADILVPRGVSNKIAIELVVTAIEVKVRKQKYGAEVYGLEKKLQTAINNAIENKGEEECKEYYQNLIKSIQAE